MAVICFADVETTGTEPVLYDHDMWEVGLIRRVVGADGVPGPDVEYAWQVGVDLGKADPRALAVNRYYERCKPLTVGAGRVVTHPGTDDASLGRGRLVPGPLAEAVAVELARLLNGCTLVAINVAFDAAFIEKFLRTHGQCPTWDYHKVEALSLAAGHLHLPPPWTSTAITERLGVAAEKDRHTGLGDTRIVRDIYDRVYAPAAA